MVSDVRDLRAALESAFEIAESGRPGPVLVDVPKDVQLASCAVHVGGPPLTAASCATPGPTYAELRRALAMLAEVEALGSINV